MRAGEDSPKAVTVSERICISNRNTSTGAGTGSGALDRGRSGRVSRTATRTRPVTKATIPAVSQGEVERAAIVS